MSLMSATELADLEKQINPEKKESFAGKTKRKLKSVKPGLPGWLGRSFNGKTKKQLRADPTYQKVAAINAVANAYSDAELQQHMIASGIPDFPNPAENAVARHLAIHQVEADLMDRVYPRESAFMTAVGASMPIGEPEDASSSYSSGSDSSSYSSSDSSSYSSGSDSTSGSDTSSLSRSSSFSDFDDVDMLFEDAVIDQIGVICDCKESTPIDETTREMVLYNQLPVEQQEAKLLDALQKDKMMEGEHAAKDSEKAVQTLEIVFQNNLPEDLKKENVPEVVEHAFHVALLDEVNKASLAEIRKELTEEEQKAVAELDRKNEFFVTVLEDTKPVGDERAEQRQKRRLREARGKLEGYLVKFGGTKQAKLRDLFGRMSRFVRAIPQQMRLKSSWIRKSIGAMAVAASLDAADLKAYDIAGIMSEGRENHPYAQHLVRQHIAADLMSMSDIHGARLAEVLHSSMQEPIRSEIGSAFVIGISPEELTKVKLKPASERKLADIPAGSQSDIVDSLKKKIDMINKANAPSKEEVNEEDESEWEVTPPSLVPANATIVPVVSPSEAAKVVAKEQQETAAVSVVEKETEKVIAQVDDAAEKTAIHTTAEVMTKVSEEDAAAVPPAVTLSYVAAVKEIVKREEFDRLQAEIKSLAQRKANEELKRQVDALTRLLAEKNKLTTTAVPEPPKGDVFQLPRDASDVVEGEREKREVAVENAMEKATETKKGAALSFFQEMMGESSKGTAGFLKEILPTLGSSVAEGAEKITSGATKAGIDGLSDAGIKAASAYADRRAEKRAEMSTPEGMEQYRRELETEKERSDLKRSKKEEVKKEKAAAREERDKAKQAKREERDVQKKETEKADAKKKRREERRAKRKEEKAAKQKQEQKQLSDAEKLKKKEERAAAKQKRQADRDAKRKASQDAKAKRQAEREAKRERGRSTSRSSESESRSASPSEKKSSRSRSRSRSGKDKSTTTVVVPYDKKNQPVVTYNPKKNQAVVSYEKKKGSSSKKSNRSRSRSRSKSPDGTSSAKDGGRGRSRSRSTSPDGTKRSSSKKESRSRSTSKSPDGKKRSSSSNKTDRSRSRSKSPDGKKRPSSKKSDRSRSRSKSPDGKKRSSSKKRKSPKRDVNTTRKNKRVIKPKDAAFPTDTFVIACGVCDATGADVVTPIECRSCGTQFDAEDEDIFEIGECKTCGIRGKQYISGKFCNVCGGRADGCDPCKSCDNIGCNICLPTSPAARLQEFREKTNIGARASIGCKSCNKKDKHTCSGSSCAICEFRRRHPPSKKTDIGTSISLVTGGEVVAVVADPLADIPPPIFSLSPWGMFVFNANGTFPFPLLQSNVEGDWQFPPSVSAVRVLGILQRSKMGTEYAVLAMNRLCCFLLYAPRMSAKYAPGAVEVIHRVLESEIPTTLSVISSPYTQEEVDWLVAGIGISFRSISDAQLWTFVYEMIIGLMTADSHATMMYRTIMGYSPLMSLVEAKKFAEANEQQDTYRFISSRFKTL